MGRRSSDGPRPRTPETSGDGTTAGRSGLPAAPSPRSLRGRTDPSRRVRPVDWTADGSRPDGGDARPATTRGAAERRDPSAPSRASAPSPSSHPGIAPIPAPRRRARTIQLPRPASPAPDAAIHALGPEDPHPAPRPLRIDEGEIRVVGAADVTAERIVEAVAEPEEAWTSDAGTSDHFLRGQLVVQVRRADNAVIGAFSRSYAMAVRPDQIDDLEDVVRGAAGRSSRRGAGTRVPTTRRDLLRDLDAAGFVVTPGSGHGRVTHPDHPGLFVPMASTPSDVRYTRYAVAQIRRVFGIDLRL